MSTIATPPPSSAAPTSSVERRDLASSQSEIQDGRQLPEVAEKAYVRRKLPLPGTAGEMLIMWVYAIPLTLIHLAACSVFVPYLFSWAGVASTVIGTYVLGGLGINLCYHRLLAHRSLVVPKWLERFFAFLALWSLEDTPGRWVAIHRVHHNHSDEEKDPHSPLVAFIWGHFGWLMIRNKDINSIGMYQKYARDILEDPFYMQLERRPYLWVLIYLSQAPFFFGVGALTGWLYGGSAWEILRMGLSLVAWGMLLRTVTVWHITWSVNSLTHTFGYRNFNTSDDSRNNWVVGLLANGEGWHNNHHADPASATVQIRWWEIDPVFYVIKLLEFVGLAKNVVPPRHVRQKRSTKG